MIFSADRLPVLAEFVTVGKQCIQNLRTVVGNKVPAFNDEEEFWEFEMLDKTNDPHKFNKLNALRLNHFYENGDRKRFIHYGAEYGIVEYLNSSISKLFLKLC